MKKQILNMALLLVLPLSLIHLSCQKEINPITNQESIETAASNIKANATSAYNLEVVLRGAKNKNGHLRFRQDESSAHIVILETTVHNLSPDHEYKLQRAVDVIIDGNCTGVNWLTLGKGLVPQPIYTNHKGDGREELWRNLSAIPVGSVFDIHFRVVDAVSLEVVLASDCYNIRYGENCLGYQIS